jgi:hypothetical protein
MKKTEKQLVAEVLRRVAENLRFDESTQRMKEDAVAWRLSLDIDDFTELVNLITRMEKSL